MAKAMLMDSDEEVIPETSSDEEDDTAQRKSLAPAWSVVTAAASTLKDMLDPRTSSITLKVLSLSYPLTHDLFTSRSELKERRTETTGEEQNIFLNDETCKIGHESGVLTHRASSSIGKSQYYDSQLAR